MKVEVRSVVINFRDSAYHARLEISDITIQSTTPDWKPANLAHTRYKTSDEESIIIYKMGNISNIKLEGWSVSDEGREGSVKLRLIAGETNVRFTLKRRIEDCCVLHSRVVVRLGDVMWVLSRSQLQAVSMLVQTLMTAAVVSAQRVREVRNGDRGWYGM